MLNLIVILEIISIILTLIFIVAPKRFPNPESVIAALIANSAALILML